MAALMDLRLFKSCLIFASILLTFLAAGVMVFGSKLEFVPNNAVPVLSMVVWLSCLGSAICRWFRSKPASDPFGRKADPAVARETALSGEAWMLDPATGRLISQTASEFHFDKLISGPSGSTLYGVVMGEAGWAGPVQLVRLDDRDGRILLAPTVEPGILQIAIGPSPKSLEWTCQDTRPNWFQDTHLSGKRYEPDSMRAAAA
jgi:hypothetical protein